MKRKILLFIIVLVSLPVSAVAVDFKIHSIRHLFDVIGPEGNAFSLPTDVVADRNGNIYVLDGVHNLVKVFDPKGKFINQFGSSGKTGGSFEAPVGIGIDRSDTIYICDTENSRIVVFDKKGKYKREIILKAVNEGMNAPRPVDIAVDDDSGLFYITDNANHMVLVYTKKGEFVRTWGGKGVGESQFMYPATLISKGRKLFVTDVLGTRVQVIDTKTWAFLAQIGKWGVESGEFFRPKGVAVDRKGLVYVTDSYMDVIQVFNEYGDFQYLLGDEKQQIKRFTSPASIFIGKNNRLYVVEMLLNRIGVYKVN